MSILKKLASDTALYGLSSIVGRLVTFVFLTPYLTRQFVPSEMGVQTDLYAWSAFLMIVFSYRMETAFFRFGSQENTRATTFRTIISTLYISTFVLITTLILLSKPLANLLEYPDHPEYVVYFAFILGADALAALPFARLRMQGQAKRFAFIKLANLAVHIITLLLLLEIFPRLGLFVEAEGASRISYVFIANLIASLATLILLLPQFKMRFRLKALTEAPSSHLPVQPIDNGVFDMELLKTMLLYAFPLLIASFAGMINEVLDRILLKELLHGNLEQRMTEVGIYGSCYKIAIFMNLFTQAFTYAAEPFFFKNADKENAKPLYANVALAFTLVMCVGYVSILLFMDIAQYFVAAPYRVGLSIVPILLLANLFLGLYYNVGIWFKLGNFSKYGAYISIIGASITIVFNLLLIPFLGYMGAAWATLICYAGMLGMTYYWGQIHYPVPYNMRKIGFHIGLAVIFGWTYNCIFSTVELAFLLKQFLNAFFFLLYLAIVLILEKNTIRKLIQFK